MASQVKFAATKLSALNKTGILKPDANGYYELVIGGLNVYNSVGEYYTLNGAQELFEESSIFMRRVKNGCLKGESGHPKKTPGITDDQYLNRILSLDEKNICCTFKEVWLDTEYGKKNPQFKNPALVAIMAKVMPSGPNGGALQKSLDNPGENVCFSIRALTKDYYDKGQTFRVLKQIFTFDNVIEPGIHISNKWDSPAMESTDEMFIRQKSLESIIKANSICLATEDSKQLAIEALKICNEDFKFVINNTKPGFANW